VRGECWEALEEAIDEPEVRKAMLAVIADAAATVEERSGAVIALAQDSSDNDAVFGAIRRLYEEPNARAAALKAMARSLDRRFAEYPPRHLDDPDPEIQKQAIWATGYLNLSSEAPKLETFFHHPRHREAALFAYVLSAPGETSRGRANALLRKIEKLAGGLDRDEEELVRVALDQRLHLQGRRPAEPPPPPSIKVGRNDPCPCGSGKKYKKCCGA
jgi:hypothetical protein